MTLCPPHRPAQQWLRVKSVQRIDTTAAATASGVIPGARSASSASSGLSVPPTLSHLRLAYTGGPGAAYPALLGLLRAEPLPQAALVFFGSAASMEAAEAFLVAHVRRRGAAVVARCFVEGYEWTGPHLPAVSRAAEYPDGRHWERLHERTASGRPACDRDWPGPRAPVD